MEFQVKTNGSNPPPQFVEFEVVYENDLPIPIEDTQGGMGIAPSQAWTIPMEVAPLMAGVMRFSISVTKTGLALGPNDATMTFTDSLGGTRTVSIRATLTKPGKKFK
jgi:hypothetical protein